MFRLLIQSGVLFVSALLVPNVMAACTYHEAVEALEQGNLIRGMALMNMASRDGDPDAIHFLATTQIKPRTHRNDARNVGTEVHDVLQISDGSQLLTGSKRLNSANELYGITH